MDSIDITKTGRPYPLGVTTEYGRTCFSVVMDQGEDCGILLYDRHSGRKKRLPFDREHRYGSIYTMAIKNLDTDRYSYNYYQGDRIFTDPYAGKLHGHEKWGKKASFLSGGFFKSDYPWEGDRPFCRPLEESILYCLNVRAFTRHSSSGVAHKGTFQGIVEKIPYLKELGITGLELMPVYEFDEVEPPFQKDTMEDARQACKDAPPKEPKLNCWGYKESFYFAPKAAYAAGADAVTEFKDMVRALHQNGMEVILQFYFPKTVKQGLILDVIKYWVLEYHIDGIHLKGERIPVSMIATEPLLSDTRIWYDDFPYSELYGAGKLPNVRNLASYNDSYMETARRFLKGDDHVLSGFLELQRKNPAPGGVINYVTNYYGFTLWDMVSYEHRHNEENGENNRDGNDLNLTWNCGAEGPCRKKSIARLRLKQMKNALTMLFFSQGAPLIYSGDEFGNTRYGNNNPYCQDNRTGWVKWGLSSMERELLAYTKSLIALRKAHPVLHNERELKNLDYMGCGYPDLSYHGEEAWRPDLSDSSRFAGAMYCGYYVVTDKSADLSVHSDNFFYIAYNMHWLEHTFALPRLPRGMKWVQIADTGEDGAIGEANPVEACEDRQRAVAGPRTIQIYQSIQEEGTEPDKRLAYGRTAF